MNIAFAKYGYEVHVSETEIRLIDRRLWMPEVLFLTLSVAAPLLLLVGGPLLAGETIGTQVPAYSMLGVGALFVVGIVRLLFIIRQRRSVSADQLANVLVIDRTTGVLRTREGETLASLSEVHAASHLDMTTRGWTRRVVIRWSSDQRIVYRSINRKHTRTVLDTLENAGVARG